MLDHWSNELKGLAGPSKIWTAAGPHGCMPMHISVAFGHFASTKHVIIVLRCFPTLQAQFYLYLNVGLRRRMFHVIKFECIDM